VLLVNSLTPDLIMLLVNRLTQNISSHESTWSRCLRQAFDCMHSRVLCCIECISSQLWLRVSPCCW
jgi:hypothetical protein